MKAKFNASRHPGRTARAAALATLTLAAAACGGSRTAVVLKQPPASRAAYATSGESPAAAREACPASDVVGGPLGIPAAQLARSSSPAQHGGRDCAYTTSDASTFVEIIIGPPKRAKYYRQSCRGLNGGAQSCAWASVGHWNYTVEIAPPDEGKGNGILRAIAASTG